MSKSSKRPSSVQSEGGVVVSGGKVVEVNHIESRPLVDIDEKSTFWFGEDYEWTDNQNSPVNGAIVRICPPANWTNAEIASVEQRLRDAGAVAVKVVRREVAVMNTNGTIERVENANPRTHREVVEVLLARTNYENPDALRAAVFRALDEGAKQSKSAIVPRGNAAIYVKSVRLFNWQRFKGQHVVELQPTVYAITAEHEEHEGRSNWLGKSSFLGAIPFALYGWHTRPKEDVWITDGENDGGVSVVLSDGTTIIRKRTRGKSTQLVLVLPDGAKLSGDEAQKEINARVGLSEADFFSTSFFVQKTIGQFVTMQPAKRQELIAGWLALGPLRAAEDWARDMLDQSIEQETKAREALTNWEREASTIAGSYGNPGAPMQVEAAIEQWIANQEAALKEAQEQAGAARSADQLCIRRTSIEQARIARARAASELGTAEQEAAGIDRLAIQDELDSAKKALQVIDAKRGVAANELTTRRSLLVEGFDGKCPVAKIDCPATGVINQRRNEAQAMFAQAKTSLDVQDKERNEAVQQVRELEMKLAQANRATQLVREKQRALEAAIEAEESLGSMPPEVAVNGSLGQLDEQVRKLAGELGTAKRDLIHYRSYQEAIAKCIRLAEQATKESTLYATAARLLGRGDGGAQKEIAVGALIVIEANTNRSLAEAGIDLRVSLKWGTESTTELATYCNKCGASFPGSKRVKVCGRCGAERGPKVDEKVDFSLSKVSGAAQDLAGFHLQIAAAAWLYGQRCVPWRMVAVDEPFGALDEAHRKAMGVHVAALLRSRYAFEQAFVIAHDVGSTDAMPSRIRIIADDESSRVEVES